MNIFIFGARRCGKTTTMLKWLKLFNLPVVCDDSSRKLMELREHGLNVQREYQGLARYARVYDDLEHRTQEVILGTQCVTIVTATPNTNEKYPVSRASEFYEFAKKRHWAIQDLGGLDTNLFCTKKQVADFVLSLGEQAALGQIYGKWYEKDKVRPAEAL